MDKIDRIAERVAGGDEWMTAADVGKVCPACEGKMKAAGISRVRRSFFEDTMRKASDKEAVSLRAEVSKQDIMEGVRTFYNAEAALHALENLWDKHWSYGNTPDSALDEMMETASEMNAFARKMSKELQSKISRWNEEARKRPDKPAASRW